MNDSPTLQWFERRVALVWFTILILAGGPLWSFAADQFAPMPVKTKTNGDVVAKIVDSAGANVAAVSAAGRVAVDASGVPVPVTDNAGSLTVDNAGSFAVQDSEKMTDNEGFTDGTTKVQPGGYVLDETGGTALTENDAAAARIDAKRAQVLVLEDATTRGQRAGVTAGGSLKVEVQGTVATSGGGATSPKLSAVTSASLASGANVTLNCTDITNGTTGKLAQMFVASSVPVKAEMGTFTASTLTTVRVAFSAAASPQIEWTPVFGYVTRTGAASGNNFAAKITNMDNALAADVYLTCIWDEQA